MMVDLGFSGRSYHIAGNIGMSLNWWLVKLTVCHHNNIAPTFNTRIKEKNSKCLHFDIETWFLNSTIAKMCPSTSF